MSTKTRMMKESTMRDETCPARTWIRADKPTLEAIILIGRNGAKESRDGHSDSGHRDEYRSVSLITGKNNLALTSDHIRPSCRLSSAQC